MRRVVLYSRQASGVEELYSCIVVVGEIKRKLYCWIFSKLVSFVGKGNKLLRKSFLVHKITKITGGSVFGGDMARNQARKESA